MHEWPCGETTFTGAVAVSVTVALSVSVSLALAVAVSVALTNPVITWKNLERTGTRACSRFPTQGPVYSRVLLKQEHSFLAA